jgi:RHS repeat-associated protein
MQMQLASIPALSQPPLAAMPQLSEKPHLGFATKKTTWNPGPNVCNFTVTLGLQVAVVENGVRKTYSARYYNPNTGRFMSRDPEDGDETDPKTLHKYVYANGDPVNAVDPTGRMAAEYALPLGIIAIPTTKVLLALGGTVGCLLLWEGGNVWANSVVASNGGYVMQLPCFALPMSKGGKQNVVHQWVLEMAKGMQGDVCAALKQIMSEARKAGDSSLFNAAKATYKATCRGYGG